MIMPIRRGDQFEHARQITGSPKAGTARPDVCTVTRVTATAVYYRNSSRMLFWTAPERLAESVGRWL